MKGTGNSPHVWTHYNGHFALDDKKLVKVFCVNYALSDLSKQRRLTITQNTITKDYHICLTLPGNHATCGDHFQSLGANPRYPFGDLFFRQFVEIETELPYSRVLQKARDPRKPEVSSLEIVLPRLAHAGRYFFDVYFDLSDQDVSVEIKRKDKFALTAVVRGSSHAVTWIKEAYPWG